MKTLGDLWVRVDHTAGWELIKLRPIQVILIIRSIKKKIFQYFGKNDQNFEEKKTQFFFFKSCQR